MLPEFLGSTVSWTYVHILLLDCVAVRTNVLLVCEYMLISAIFPSLGMQAMAASNSAGSDVQLEKDQRQRQAFLWDLNVPLTRGMGSCRGHVVEYILALPKWARSRARGASESLRILLCGALVQFSNKKNSIVFRQLVASFDEKIDCGPNPLGSLFVILMEFAPGCARTQVRSTF